ncbi:MAG: GAF domain-containing protein [Bryobacteraceae bacterium]|jgi:adenylate cyclase
MNEPSLSRSSALTVPLDHIAGCFEGVIPANICSCDREGTPNLTYLSLVHRLDQDHVGLSHQFFNKTRKNILENPWVQVIVTAPQTFEQFRLDLRYERTDAEGPAFDRMKTRLDAVASQTGMSQVFRLRGVDVYQVLDCRLLNSEVRTESIAKIGYLTELETFTERLAACGDLDSLFDASLDSLSALFGYDYSFVMVPDEEGKRLYTLASHGYQASGAGSEVWIGEGILGIAAERRTVVRTTNMIVDKLLSRAVRSAVERRGEEEKLEREIALPGLADAVSQIVVPLLAQNELLGVLCLQSPTPGRFLSDDERVMQIAARHLAASMTILGRQDPTEGQATPTPSQPMHPAAASVIKHYAIDDSIFIDNDYLIKGIAGRIFWKLVRDNSRTGRADFTNKEIRRDASLQLPDFKDNLESRLILLRRRLQDHCSFLRLVQAGRGQFHLEVQRRLTLEEHS